MKKLVVIVALFSAIALAASAAQAGFILTQGYPDLYMTSNVFTYDATGMTFTATGRPTTFTIVAGSPYNVSNMTATSYSLSAAIDNSGVGSAGSLTVGGKIAALGATSGTLLTGTFADFDHGTSSNGDPFKFLFTVTGGDLASYYGGLGGQIGIILMFF